MSTVRYSFLVQTRWCRTVLSPSSATRSGFHTSVPGTLLQHATRLPCAPVFARRVLSRKPVISSYCQRRSHAYNIDDQAGSKQFRDFDLAGGVYIVTGGGRGLGLCMAQALAEAGGKVYCLDRLEQPVQDFADASAAIPAAFGGSLSYARVDVRDARALDRLVGAIADRHRRLDGVIAAAGVQQLKAAVDYTVDEVRDMLDVNYTGVFMTCASAARCMFKWNPGHRDGAMVIIASMSGSVANKGLICPVYNSSKAALLQLTRSLAMEWSGKGREHPSGLGGIRVNSLSPGHILTPMVKRNFEEVPGLREKWERENMMGRLSTPEEFKGAGLFLLSRASSFMTGSNLIIDGGHTAW